MVTVGWLVRRSRRAGAVAAVVLALVAAACGDDSGGEETGGGSLGDGSLGVVEVAPGQAIQIRSVLELEGESGSGPTSEKVVRLAVADYGPIPGKCRAWLHVGAPIDDGARRGGEAAGRAISRDRSRGRCGGHTCSGGRR